MSFPFRFCLYNSYNTHLSKKARGTKVVHYVMSLIIHCEEREKERKTRRRREVDSDCTTADIMPVQFSLAQNAGHAAIKNSVQFYSREVTN